MGGRLQSMEHGLHSSYVILVFESIEQILRPMRTWLHFCDFPWIANAHVCVTTWNLAIRAWYLFIHCLVKAFSTFHSSNALRCILRHDFVASHEIIHHLTSKCILEKHLRWNMHFTRRAIRRVRGCAFENLQSYHIKNRGPAPPGFPAQNIEVRQVKVTVKWFRLNRM